MSTHPPAHRRLRRLVQHLSVPDAPSGTPSVSVVERGAVGGGPRQITDLKCYYWTQPKASCIVKVELEGGVYGWGESGLVGRELAVAGAIEHFKQFLIGQDGMRIGALWQQMYRSQYFEGGRVLTAAISAVDIALHDAVSKALDVPLHQLLGGAQRDFCPCFVTPVATPMGPGLIEEVQLLLEEGWECVRLCSAGLDRPTDMTDPASIAEHEARIFEPRPSIAQTAEWMTKLRAAVGHGPVLGVEYHHRLSVAEATSFCQKMPPGTLDFLEEPIRDETPEAYEVLRTMTDVPFAVGEEFASKWQFLPYLERGLTQFARLDICNVGGFTEAMKVASLCETHYIDLMPHNPLGPICTAAVIHLAAAVPNFAWLEERLYPRRELRPGEPSDTNVAEERHDPRVYTQIPVREGGRGTPLGGAPCYRVPRTQPGLGIEVDEAFAAELTSREEPHGDTQLLRRRDGSRTNS